MIKTHQYSRNVTETRRLSLQNKYEIVMSEMLDSLAKRDPKHTITRLCISARSSVRALSCVDKFEQFYCNSLNLTHVLFVVYIIFTLIK